jgi:hypothetical protein
MVAQDIFMLTITWLLSMVVGTIKMDNDNNCKQIAGNFDHHTDAVKQCRAHPLMEHIQGFTRSHWMPPLGKCLRCIALEVAMVDNFECKHKNTNKTQLLASNLGYNQPQKT